MNEHIPVLIFLPPHGSSEVEVWLAQGRRAAALDMVARLQALPQSGEIFCLVEAPQDREALADAGAQPLPDPPFAFQFGRTLGYIIEAQGFERLAYFGGGSAPLLSGTGLAEIFERTATAQGRYALVNNLHSSDWAVMNSTKALQGVTSQLPNDNALGWVLAHEAGVQVDSLPPGAGSRADVDTPADLLMMVDHPDLGDHLKNFLVSAPADMLAKLRQVRSVLKSEAKHLTVIGRASSHIWGRLERETRIWVRMLTEERGMIANGRLARGEVKSIVGALLDDWGAEAFVGYLSSISDAVLWDTRVWMAHHFRAWPPPSERFAADLGKVDEIQDPDLRSLTYEILNSPVPIVIGGYGVVSGGLYALLDGLEG